jgi:hypothetical protein
MPFSPEQVKKPIAYDLKYTLNQKSLANNSFTRL